MMSSEAVVEPVEQVVKTQKRAQLTAAVKQDLCEFKRQNQQATQEQIADYVYQKFNIKINRSTVAKILKHQEKWINIDTSDASQANKKRMRAAKHQHLEAGLYEWYEQVSSSHPQEYTHGTRPNDQQLIQRAMEMAQELGIADNEFKASQGWLANFKKRFSIRPRHPIVDPPQTIHIVHPGLPAETIHTAEAHALAQAHMLPGPSLEQFQTHALHIHYARAIVPQPPPPPQLMAEAMAQAQAQAEAAAAEQHQDSSKTAHLCAQQVRAYILKNPQLFHEASLKAIDDIIDKIGRNACYGQAAEEYAMALARGEGQDTEMEAAAQ